MKIVLVMVCRSIFLGIFLLPFVAAAFNPAEQQRLITSNKCPNCDLTDVKLSGFDLPGAKLTGADLSGADLTKADLSARKVHYIKHWQKNTPKDKFTPTDLFGANLTGTDLSGADLSDARLVKSNLTKANLTGADLTGAILTGAILKNATWTDGSKCNEGSVGECIK